MKITLKNIDPVNATLTVEVAKDDYANEVKKALKGIRDSVNLPGFRKGMAPQSLIQKQYGKPVLVDEVNKLVSKSLYDYIRENKLNVLGEPLPSAGEQKPLDFDNQSDYEFSFDIAIAPEMDVKLTKDDKLPYYSISVTDEMIEKQVNSFKANYGTYSQVEDMSQEKDMAKGLLIELNSEGTPITVEDAVLMPSYMKNEEEKAKFADAKLGDVITFNPYKAYDGAEAELASFLKIKKEEVAQHQSDFTFKITEITRYAEAEMNQELFDKAYGPDGGVKSEEDFRNKIKETITAQLAPEGDYKFIVDAKALLEEKAKDIQFPDAFLKRWLVASNEDRTEEMVEQDYSKILADLKFHLIKEKIVKDNNIKIEADDVKQYAINATRAQFAQYGMSNVPDELLENYSQEMLKKEETVRQLVDKAVEDKVIAILKEEVTLEPKEISVEDFQKLFEA